MTERESKSTSRSPSPRRRAQISGIQTVRERSSHNRQDTSQLSPLDVLPELKFENYSGSDWRSCSRERNRESGSKHFRKRSLERGLSRNTNKDRDHDRER